ncbi:MAG: cytidylate kinase-like family protein [bacterium]
MTIVSISRGSNSRGTEVAIKVARRLGYRCLAREALLRASGLFNIPEDELLQAVEQPPSVLERLLDGKARYIATIRATLLNQFRTDDVVYHGFAGQFFIKDISHALKVRILAELPDRVATVVQRIGVSEPDARQMLVKLDKARRQWGLYLYGIDPEDPSLYDLVLHVGKMGTDGAAEIICNLARHDPFATTPESRAALDELALTASVRAALFDLDFDLEIASLTAKDGVVQLRIAEPPFSPTSADREFRTRHLERLRLQIDERTRNLPGLKGLHLDYADA